MTRRVQVASFVLGVALLALLVSRVGVQTLVADFHRAGWTVVPILLVWGVVYAMNTAAWLLLVGGGTPSLPAGQAFVTTVSAFALNYVTPFLALGGEALRVTRAAAWIGTRRAAASVVAFRVAHTAGQFVFWLLTIPIAFVLLPPTLAVRALLALVAVVLCAGTVLLAAMLRARTLERLLGVLPRVPLLRRLAPQIERRRPALLALDAALESLAREQPRRVALAVGVEAASRFVATLEFLLIARSVGAPVSFGAAAVVAAFYQLVVNVLFFVPLSLGTKEGGLFAAFRLLGYAPRIGVYGAIVSRLREVVWITIGLAFIWLGRRAPRAASDL